ncbi:MAG: aminoacyl-tRNA hydrolase [Fimbriimonadaceae bacterium]|nr:aminoacyl-tRNA hydrolase [Chitinophagales bacterium]
MIQIPDLVSECIFKAVRSSGKGGQHVNKVSTKIELYFTPQDSQLLSDQQKNLLYQKLNHLMNEEGTIRITSDAHRSQKQNKEEAIEKLNQLILKALTPKKRRIKTKTPKSVKEKRIKDKKVKSTIKEMRKKPGLD